MKTRTRRPRGLTRLARALGLDRNPLRRAIDRAEAWIRVGLLAVFLIAGPMAALAAGYWAYHAGITAARVSAAPTHGVKPAALQGIPTTTDPPRVGQGGRAGARRVGAGPSARTGGVLAAVMTLAAMALALLAALRLALALLSRRRLTAWEMAWSESDRSGPSAGLDILHPPEVAGFQPRPAPSCRFAVPRPGSVAFPHSHGTPCRSFVPGRVYALLTIADIFDNTTIRREQTAFPPRPEAGVSTSRL